MEKIRMFGSDIQDYEVTIDEAFKHVEELKEKQVIGFANGKGEIIQFMKFASDDIALVMGKGEPLEPSFSVKEAQKIIRLYAQGKHYRLLEIELVPITCWGISLCNGVKGVCSKKRWAKIRQQYIKEQGRKCEVCGETKGQMYLHEQWSYDGGKHIRKLVGLILVCEKCHLATHIGRTKRLVTEGKITLSKGEDVLKHYCKVNFGQVNLRTLEMGIKDYNNAVELFKERSKYQWTDDFSLVDNLLFR